MGDDGEVKPSKKLAQRPAKKVAWKALEFGIGMAAALVTRKALRVGWTSVTNTSAPPDPSDRKVPISDALIWMVAAGVGMGISRVIAVRTAATVWEAATDEPPPT
jgi:hypothetical protein